MFRRLSPILILAAVLIIIFSPFSTQPEKKVVLAEGSLGSKCISSKPKYSKLKDLDSLIEAHNKYANCLFNEGVQELQNSNNMKKLIQKVEAIDKTIETAQESKENKEEYCAKKENVSQTFCVAYFAVQDYKEFRDRVLVIRDDAIAYATQVEGGDQTQNDSLTRAQTAESRVNEELNLSNEALKQSLESYNQMRVAYPLHYALNDPNNSDSLMKNLEQYRDQLKKLREYVYLLPPKFKDATTPGAGCD